MDDYFEIGEIVNTQGVKGEVRVIPSTDEPDRFELLDEILAVVGREPCVYAIEHVRYHKAFVILKLAGVNDMNAAERLKGAIIKIPPEKALPLAEDEYYHRDLLGMDVITDEGEGLGVVGEIMQTGANDVYVVKKPGHKDILLPAIKACVLSVSVSERKMVVHMMEGLRP